MSCVTIYVTKLQLKLAHIDIDQYPNAGPNCSIAGMKREFWGEDAYCLKNGEYVYHVPLSIYNQFSNIGNNLNHIRKEGVPSV